MTNSSSTLQSPAQLEARDGRETILKVEAASKKFAVSIDYALRYGTKRIFRELFGIKGNTSELRPGEIWAVKDVSFELRRGETLGIIGANGAGKSTLLKMINGVFVPDKGSVAVRGTVGGLIEIGAGFQPKLTGRENIYVIAAMLGFSKHDVDNLVEDIIEFADVGAFLDSPVQSYSSGMQVRLGFAIHVFQKPDLLLADEVLAVGDFEFQQKCLAKINEIRKDIGMILVSHSMPTVSRFCTRVIVMEKGGVLYDGEPREAVTIFTSRRAQLMSTRGSDSPGSGGLAGDSDLAEHRDEPEVLCRNSGIKLPKGLYGSEYVNSAKISEVRLEWSSGPRKGIQSIPLLAELTLTFSFRIGADTDRLVIGVPFHSIDGTLLTACNTDSAGVKVSIPEDGVVCGRLIIDRFSLVPGDYVPCLVIQDGWEFVYRKVLQPLSVMPRPSSEGGHSLYFGVFLENFSWQV